MTDVGERSKGKARPSLTRSGDLRATDAVGEPTAQRDAQGRFTAGNRVGVERGLKLVCKKATGNRHGNGETAIIARDARRVVGAILATLPSDAAPVRVLVSIHGRHVALHGYYTAKAEEAGLGTPEGQALLAIADRQSQRAERVLVTALDTARVCAEQAAKVSGPVDVLAAFRLPTPEGDE